MSERNDYLIAEEILEAVEKIETFTSGQNFEQFSNDAKTIDAVLMNLILIGEVTARLSEEFKDSHSKIDWFRIRGLRNRVVHDYKGVNLEIIWNTINTEMKELKDYLIKII